MPAYTLPFQIDAVGVPPGDAGRAGGWSVVGDTDYGRAVSVAGDGKTIQVQITGVQKPRIRFLPNKGNLAELTTLLGLTCAGQPSSQPGVITAITATAVHRRQALTNLDTAPISVIATIEQPASANLSTIWAFDLPDLASVTTTSPSSARDPLGQPWTPGSLALTEFSLQLLDLNGGFHPYASLYIVDLFALTVMYSVTQPFPVPVVGGGHGCECDLEPGALAGVVGTRI